MHWFAVRSARVWQTGGHQVLCGSSCPTLSRQGSGDDLGAGRLGLCKVRDNSVCGIAQHTPISLLDDSWLQESGWRWLQLRAGHDWTVNEDQRSVRRGHNLVDRFMYS